MPSKPAGKDTVSLNPQVLAFRPRSVLLLSNSSNTKQQDDFNTAKMHAPMPDKKAILLLSVARFLEHSGFRKTLKAFLSEAKVERDDLASFVLDLEEVFFKSLDLCETGYEKARKFKVQGENTDAKLLGSEHDKEIICDPMATCMRSKEKKSKRKKVDSNDQIAQEDADVAEVFLESMSEIKHDLPTKKTKKEGEGKCNLDSDYLVNNGGHSEGKNKKKKKQLAVAENLCYGQDPVEVKSALNGSKKDEPNKVSKKRKRLHSEEDSEKLPLGANVMALHEERPLVDSHGSTNLSTEEPHKNQNGNIAQSGEKATFQQKSNKRQKKDSVEPKIVKRFQRVEVDDDVACGDERLKDNSYWAKDGAEKGYGAKAQEILEKVRGRNFKHEKTKKKRGTYKGGQIDVQAHSIKFSYSDED